MDEREILIACFGLGVALQATLLIRGDWNWWKLAGSLAFGMLAMLPGRHERVYDPLFHVLMVFSFFSVAFAFMFREDILPLISEVILLSYTLAFWFAFFVYFYSRSPLRLALLLLLAVPTAASVFVAFRKTQLGFVFKLVLYTWFLVIMICLGLFQFPYSQLILFSADHQVPWVTPAESATAGMAFLFLLANATYVFYLIPMRDKHESWEERMKTWHAFTDLITQRFADARVTLLQAVIVVGVEGTVLLLDGIYRWFAPGFVINLAIVIPSMFFHPRFLPASTAESHTSDVDVAARVPHSRHLLKGKYRRAR